MQIADHSSVRRLLRLAIRFIAVFAGGVALASCASSDYPFTTVAEANSSVSSDHLLGPGDEIRVTVFDEENLSGEFQIDTAGTLALPLIEPVAISGMTPAQLAETIRGRLDQGGYVLNPQVSVDVLSYRPIYVLGQVGQPGEYPYTANMNHLQAIAKAGGYTARADKGSLVLQRSHWESPREMRLSADPLLVQPGDTIIVKEAFF